MYAQSSELSSSSIPYRKAGFISLRLQACHMSQPISLFLILSHEITFGEQYRSLSSSLCNFLHAPVTSSLLDPNTLLNTLFSNTLSLRSSFRVTDQVSHPYKTTVLYILMFGNKGEDERFSTKRWQTLAEFDVPLRLSRD